MSDAFGDLSRRLCEIEQQQSQMSAAMLELTRATAPGAGPSTTQTCAVAVPQSVQDDPNPGRRGYTGPRVDNDQVRLAAAQRLDRSISRSVCNVSPGVTRLLRRCSCLMTRAGQHRARHLPVITDPVHGVVDPAASTGCCRSRSTVAAR